MRIVLIGWIRKLDWNEGYLSGEPWEQVQDDAISLGLWKAQPGSHPQPHWDAGEIPAGNLVSKSRYQETSDLEFQVKIWFKIRKILTLNSRSKSGSKTGEPSGKSKIQDSTSTVVPSRLQVWNSQLFLRSFESREDQTVKQSVKSRSWNSWISFSKIFGLAINCGFQKL